MIQMLESPSPDEEPVPCSADIGARVGTAVGAGPGTTVGAGVGASNTGGDAVGDGDELVDATVVRVGDVGRIVGRTVGATVATAVGPKLGAGIGVLVGRSVGVGSTVGSTVGVLEGPVVGAVVGLAVGAVVGAPLGASVGVGVKMLVLRTKLTTSTALDQPEHANSRPAKGLKAIPTNSSEAPSPLRVVTSVVFCRGSTISTELDVRGAANIRSVIGSYAI